MDTSGLQSTAMFLHRLRHYVQEQVLRKKNTVLREHALDYNKCTTTELRKFIADRSGQILPWKPKHSKGYLIRILEDLDRKAGFRFLDLPPEMRNEVYGYILVHDKAARLIAYPELLRTSRFVYGEGITILNDESVVQLSAIFTKTLERIRVYTTPPNLHELVHHPFGRILQQTKFTARVEGDLRFSIDMNHNNIPSFIKEQLLPLQCVRNLHLDLNFCERGGLAGEHQIDAWRSPETFVRTLVTVCRELNYLRVTVNQRGSIINSRVRVDAALIQLGHLDSLVTLDLRDLVRPSLYDFLQRLSTIGPGQPLW